MERPMFDVISLEVKMIEDGYADYRYIVVDDSPLFEVSLNDYGALWNWIGPKDVPDNLMRYLWCLAQGDHKGAEQFK